ncbi:Planctomycete cytochrome C [Neorhodopirellula lusitana]|uniref:Planctomycete cytochrome C n=1 Tax=Neorhodopirellula lusitana TaxID=445327 RepID=A0ABY1QCU9_9BACT|nr:PSD1 and planctomycete cytochrome C domain-containing protein [Neorhodopirellula lusitana]SMP67574.1 Planctomycete cytochrome C [Neorhodopirellula lusitana]
MRSASVVACFFVTHFGLAQIVALPNVQAAGGEAVSDAGEHDGFYSTKVKPILAEHCFECHGDDPEDLSGGLALTSREAIRRGGDSGIAINGDQLDESILLKAINYDTYEMPPEGKLASDQIAVLTKWVVLGVPIPVSEEIEISAEQHSSVPQVNEKTKKWWSFQPVRRPNLPSVSDDRWPQNGIDAFVLSGLDSVGLKPAPPASKSQLLRRISYDLTGLPPTPEKIEAFVQSDDPDAYHKVVEELLQSPHYGEKWGRHWLDLVRYAETNSFERDDAKPFVWRYRDYVIRSFNEDKPYDQFLIEQLAGDELPNPSVDNLIATGYYRLGSWDDEPADSVQAKFDELDDILGVTCKTILGLTVDCARCHDHKIDPVPQADYYSMLSFFENIRRYGVRSGESVEDASIRSVPGGEIDEEESRLYQEKLAKVQRQIDTIESIVKADFAPVEHEEYTHPTNRLRLVKQRVGTLLSQKQFDQYKRATKAATQLQARPPGEIRILSVKEAGSTAEASFIRVRGNANIPGKEVQPSFVSVLSPPDPEITVPEHGESTGRRMALARWMASTDNPLTARVMVNRLWQYHFGRGIVRSSSDFGFQGDSPTHPELLDWLAAEFVSSGWSMKAMHRLILHSSTYQMSGQYSQAAYDVDPANDRLWRFDLKRLTAEEIRDSILAVNHQLNLEKMFGPSFFPIQPKEVLAGQSQPGKGWGDSSAEERRRRSVYIHVKRSLPVPILSTNDSADTDNTCAVRFITTQPTQALGMMNSEFTNEQAWLLADSVIEESAELEGQVVEVLSRVMQREPSPKEIENGVKFVEELQAEDSMSSLQALRTFCLLALNLNEFVYIE